MYSNFIKTDFFQNTLPQQILAVNSAYLADTSQGVRYEAGGELNGQLILNTLDGTTNAYLASTAIHLTATNLAIKHSNVWGRQWELDLSPDSLVHSYVDRRFPRQQFFGPKGTVLTDTLFIQELGLFAGITARYHEGLFVPDGFTIGDHKLNALQISKLGISKEGIALQSMLMALIDPFGIQKNFFPKHSFASLIAPNSLGVAIDARTKAVITGGEQGSFNAVVSGEEVTNVHNITVLPTRDQANIFSATAIIDGEGGPVSVRSGTDALVQCAAIALKNLYT